MLKKIKEILNIDTKKPTILSFEDKMSALFESLQVDELSIIIGSDIEQYTDSILSAIWELRKKIKNKTGLIIPAIRIKDSNTLQENEYQICVREKVVFNGFVIPKCSLTKNEILNSLEFVCKEYMDEIISCETIEKYIDLVRNKSNWITSEVGNHFYIFEIKNILLKLVKNDRSIKDIHFIFEQINKNMKTDTHEELINKITSLLPESKWDIEKYDCTKKLV